MRRTQRIPKRAVNHKCTGWQHPFGHLPQQSDGNCRYSRLLDHALNQSDGLVAKWSDGSQQNSICSILA